MKRGEDLLKQADEFIGKNESAQAQHSLDKAKAALKHALPSGKETEIKPLLGEVYLKCADLLKLSQNFTIEEVRKNYTKAQRYLLDENKQEEIRACLASFPASPAHRQIQRKPTLPPSSVPAILASITGLPAGFFTGTTSSSTPNQPLKSYRFVGPNDITDTRHLAWCLQKTACDPESSEVQKQLYSLAREVIEQFGKRKGKDLICMREAAELATVPYIKIYSQLIDHAVQALNLQLHPTLNIDVVQGLAIIVRNCPEPLLKKEGGVNANIWTSILSVSLERLKIVHKGETVPVQQLVQSISQLLDAMVQAGVAGISREQLQKPLNDELRDEDKLNPHKDAELAWQIRYAREALAYIPNDESTAKAVLRCLFNAGVGILKLASAVKNCDVGKLLESFDHFEDTFAGVLEVANTIGSSSGLKEAINSVKEASASFDELKADCQDRSRQKGWYAALQCLDMLIGTKEWVKFEAFVRQSAYRQNADFLQGICQRLERIICTQEDETIQKQAIQFLQSLQQDTTLWMNEKAGAQALFKQGSAKVKQKAQTTLEQLERRATQLESNDIDVSWGWGSVSQSDLSTQLLDAARAKLKKLLLQKLLGNLQDNIQKLKSTYLEGLQQDKEIKDALTNYVAPEGILLNDTGRFDLKSKVQDFLNSDKKTLLLLGDAGSGKSTFNRHLACTLWETYIQTSAAEDIVIPVFISLSSLPETGPNLVSTFFETQEFSKEQIRELQIKHRFVLILDGFDEIKDRHRSFYKDNQLDKWKNAKIIISSRPEYLGPNYQYKFHSSEESTALQEYWLAPFSEKTVKLYIDRYSETHPHALWSAERYKKALEEPGLKELVSNPFLLKMAMGELPILSQIRQAESQRFTRIALYDQFVKSWFDRSQQRLAQIQLNAEEITEFKRLEQEGFAEHGMDFSKELAKEMYLAGEVVTTYSATATRERRINAAPENNWRKRLLSNDSVQTKLKRLNAPLICQNKTSGSGQEYRFIHKSLQDYFVAQALGEELRGNADGEDLELSKKLSVVKNIGRLWDDLRDGLDLEQSALFNVLNVVKDPAVQSFLIEQVRQDPGLLKPLLGWVKASKARDNVERAAANALTIVVKAGVRLNGLDLSRIKVPGADLSDGLFEETQFKGADLSGVDFQGAWLESANLEKAKLDEVNFGQLPNLELKAIDSRSYDLPDGSWLATNTMHIGDQIKYYKADIIELRTLEKHSREVNRKAFSPSGKILASGNVDGSVKLCRVESGELMHTLPGHNSEVSSISFSASGEMVASGSIDGTVQLWRVESGELMHTLPGHSGEVVRMTFLLSEKGGAAVVSESIDGTVELQYVTDKNYQPFTNFEAINWRWDSYSYFYCEDYLLSEKVLGRENLGGENSGLLMRDTRFKVTITGHIIKINSIILKSIPNNCAFDYGDFSEGCRGVKISGPIDKKIEDRELNLYWAPSQSALNVNNMSIQNADGLSSTDTRLLRQRGARCEPPDQKDTLSKPALITNWPGV
ncbi:NACHT domain-containing protein [Mycoavidus cysteinexigens]|nr:NACHT domain-containing protein [Mycoavidus cysteinexigens]